MRPTAAAAVVPAASSGRGCAAAAVRPPQRAVPKAAGRQLAARSAAALLPGVPAEPAVPEAARQGHSRGVRVLEPGRPQRWDDVCGQVGPARGAAHHPEALQDVGGSSCGRQAAHAADQHGLPHQRRALRAQPADAGAVPPDAAAQSQRAAAALCAGRPRGQCHAPRLVLARRSRQRVRVTVCPQHACAAGLLGRRGGRLRLQVPAAAAGTASGHPAAAAHHPWHLYLLLPLHPRAGIFGLCRQVGRRSVWAAGSGGSGGERQATDGLAAATLAIGIARCTATALAAGGLLAETLQARG